MYKKILVIILIIGLILGIYLFYNPIQKDFPEINKEFKIQGVTWSTFSYYFNEGCYDWVYNSKHSQEIIEKAKNAGANYLLLRAFYNGTSDGGLIGNDEEVKSSLKNAIKLAHEYNLSIVLIPYVESRDYHSNPIWNLDKNIWTEKVLMLAKFAEENKIEMFTPGIEMNLILKEESGEYMKEILPKIREIYTGKISTAEQYDIENWKRIDNVNGFQGYDCIGLTLFPRKNYDGVNDIKSFEDYEKYVEEEAKVIDNLSKKYNISCKLALPMGMDYWKGSALTNPVPDASIVAEATDKGLDILLAHNFTGAFISHWASVHDHFGKREDVEIILKERWTK